MSSRDYLHVVVTGNPPFMEYDYNTSQLVRDALPEVIERRNKKDIRILKYFRDTLDTYEDVRSVSKDIWSGKRSLFLPEPKPGDTEEHVDVDYILHLGMIALGWDPDQFRFETIARRDGYGLPGDDGKYVDSNHLKNLGLPETLTTSLDVEAAWRKVKQQHPDVTSCVSNDAGLYFCEFRLYSSLAEPFLSKEVGNKKGRVAFEHLPQTHSREAIELARDITVTYITGLADNPIFHQGDSKP